MLINLEIPTEGGRPFTEQVTLLDVVYTLKFNWNKRAKCWVLDIWDEDNQFKILAGIPLVTGADLLEQFLYLPIGRFGIMTALTFGPGIPPDNVPTFYNLGTDGHLYYSYL
jgi:hypothetical protein